MQLNLPVVYPGRMSAPKTRDRAPEIRAVRHIVASIAKFMHDSQIEDTFLMLLHAAYACVLVVQRSYVLLQLYICIYITDSVQNYTNFS